MNEQHGTTQPIASDTAVRRFNSQHRFLIMIALAVSIAIAMTGIGLALYASSGAAQLDLSRPGYSDVRSKTTTTERFQGYPSVGSINEASLKEFRDLYESQLEQATAVDAFSGDVLSDEALQIE